MPRNVLEIARSASASIRVSDVTSLVNNRQEEARVMLALLNTGGINLSRERNTWGAGWTVLTREYEFTTTPNVREYALPDDFQALIDGTFWDRSTYREARGTLSPQQWQQVRSGLVESIGISPLYRLVRNARGTGRALVLDPIPSSRDDLVIEYTSTDWLRNADASEFHSRIQADTDVPLFDDDLVEMDLVWRFKQGTGLAYAVELAEYNIERRRRLAEDAGSRAITIGRQGFGRGRLNVPLTGFGVG